MTALHSDDDEGPRPTLPAGLSPYSHQVGGHGFSGVSSGSRLLRHPVEPILYKKFQSKGRGISEAKFYLQVFSESASPAFAKFRPFLPKFQGVFQDPVTADCYLAIEDVLAPIINPSVCDLKMGRVSYPADIGEAKLQAARRKYPHLEDVGFVFTGMKILESGTRQYLTVPRHYGRSLDLGQIYCHALLPFLQGDFALAEAFRSKIGEMLTLFTEPPLPSFALFCSSLLLAYDESRSTVLVKLVDFSHWRSVDPHARIQDPSGFLQGLQNLINFLSQSLPGLPHSAPFTRAS